MIVLIIGQNKNPEYFKKSINIYLNYNNISKILLFTWYDTIIEDDIIDLIKNNKDKIYYEKVPKFIPDKPNKNNYYSSLFQKHLYDLGIKWIKNNLDDKELFILKTRMDIVIEKNQLDYILKQDYKITDTELNDINYKIWIAWAHLTKPFYFEDGCFFSHISVMDKMIKDDTYQVSDLGQGFNHIRWFLHYANNLDIYKKEDYHLYKNIHKKFVIDEHKINTIKKYKSCINKYFIINTQPKGVLFRQWSNIHFYKPPSDKFIDINNRSHKDNLKIVYSLQDFNKYLNF